MYQIIIGFYLLYTAKNNLTRLFSLENGINSFTKIDWVLLVLSFLMIPLSILMFYTGYKAIKEKRESEKAEAEEKEIEDKRKRDEMFSEYEADITISEEDSEKNDKYTSRYDS